MDKKELLEYEKKEEEKVQNIVEDATPGTLITVKDFFPELVRSLDPPFTGPNYAPFWVALPFYNSLIVDIYPYPNAHALERTHNISVEDLMKLKDDGTICFRLAGRPSIYSGLDYLDPILKTQPPSILRLQSFFLTLLASKGSNPSEKYNAYSQTAKELFANKLNYLHNKRNITTPRRAFEGSIAMAYVDMRVLGFDLLTDKIKSLAEKFPDQAAMFLEMYHELLCKPLLNLGGGSFCSAEYMNVASTIPLTEKADLDISSMGHFPAEVGKLLTEKYKLVKPSTLSEALDVYSDYEEARDALRALVQEVKNPRQKRVETLSKQVSKVFDNVSEVYEKKERYDTVLQVLGVVGAGVVGYTGGVAGLIGSLGLGSLLTTDISKPIAERLAQLGYSSHLVALYNFDKELNTD